ncbi:MAG TPA: PA2779 family protein [Thermoanaerobaculia bacterium]|nr:PA2779 family protein [Thermoanaerobaculia bacterium]
MRPLGAGIKEKEVLVKKSLIVVALLVMVALPTLAAPVPSKTAPNQSIESREADLALVRDVAANDQVAKVLAANGFTQEQVNQRLAQMSPQDLHQLAQNIDQLQAAGLTKQEWIWVGIGALAALVLVVALN